MRLNPPPWLISCAIGLILPIAVISTIIHLFWTPRPRRPGRPPGVF